MKVNFRWVKTYSWGRLKPTFGTELEPRLPVPKWKFTGQKIGKFIEIAL